MNPEAGARTGAAMLLIVSTRSSSAASFAAGARRSGIGWHRPTDRYYLTDRGRDQLPAVQPAAVMRPYVVPVQPPRRAGSMRFTSLPSLAAGVARDWRHPC